MIVKVTSTYSGDHWLFEGTPADVLAKLLEFFPWASRGPHREAPHDPTSLADVMKRVGSADALALSVVDPG